MRTCTQCGQRKPLGDFYRQDGKPQAACKACRRAWVAEYKARNREAVRARDRAYAKRRAEDPAFRERRRQRERELRAVNPDAGLRQRVRRQFGMSLDEYRAALARGCAICGSTEGVVMDHDHGNGRVREALCNRCNVGIGHLGDDPARLRAAADYIEKHRARPLPAGGAS